MSFKSWCAEFYPKAASRVPKKDATAHSLKKWIGLRKPNLSKHGLVLVEGDVYEKEHQDTIENDPALWLDASTCALCARHWDKDACSCSECPLFLVRGVKCYDRRSDEDTSPYQERHSSPEPMIFWLRKALAWEKRQKKGKQK